MKLQFKKGEGIKMTHNFPDEEAIDALVLTARMFIQKNDPVSFPNMRNVLQDRGLSAEWKLVFNHIDRLLEEMLESTIPMKIDERTYTNREMVDIFIYGGFAHTDPIKSPIYDKWRAAPPLYLIVESRFHGIITRLLEAVGHVADATRKELAGEPITLLPKVSTESGKQLPPISE